MINIESDMSDFGFCTVEYYRQEDHIQVAVIEISVLDLLNKSYYVEYDHLIHQL